MPQPSLHTAEDLFVKGFLSRRLINIDEAYNKLLQDVVTELKRGSQAWPRYDLDYILSQVKMETCKFETSIYFDANAQNNGVVQIPPTVLEITPRRDELLAKSTAF